jgi:hypothetical protein
MRDIGVTAANIDVFDGVERTRDKAGVHPVKSGDTWWTQ